MRSGRLKILGPAWDSSSSNKAHRHIVLEDAAQPTYGLPVSAEWKDLADEGGKTISFTIRYRSRGKSKSDAYGEALLTITQMLCKSSRSFPKT
jgi:hypothetical protein